MTRKKGAHKIARSAVSAKSKPALNQGLHVRNLHKQGYEFDALKKSLPELSKVIIQAPSGHDSINFSDAKSVKLLNQALLKCYYQIDFWDLPEHYLCPAIPGRVDYIHYLADVLCELNANKIPTGKKIKALDIGTGANCVYPMVGHRSYGWQFVASDVDPVSVKTATLLTEANKGLKANIDCRLQKTPRHIFTGIIGENEHFDLTLCNPPFHASLAEATTGSARKQKNLAANKHKRNASAKVIEPAQVNLNFSGQGGELWCKGGELAFLTAMIKESLAFSQQCLWFTSLVSKGDNIKPLQAVLKKIAAAEVKVIEMHHGQKKTRILAWTFLNPEQQKLWAQHYWH